MTTKDVKVMAYDVIRKAVHEWAFEDKEGFVLFCDGICMMAEAVANELDRVKEGGVRCVED